MERGGGRRDAHLPAASSCGLGSRWLRGVAVGRRRDPPWDHQLPPGGPCCRRTPHTGSHSVEGHRGSHVLSFSNKKIYFENLSAPVCWFTLQMAPAANAVPGRNQELPPGFPRGCRGPGTRAILHCLPRRVSRERDRTWSTRDSNPRPRGILASQAGGGGGHCAPSEAPVFFVKFPQGRLGVQIMRWLQSSGLCCPWGTQWRPQLLGSAQPLQALVGGEAALRACGFSNQSLV